MKAIITNASELDFNGVQTVSFDIVDDDNKVLASNSIGGDVETLEELVKAQVVQYEAKAKSGKRLKVGDEIEA